MNNLNNNNNTDHRATASPAAVLSGIAGSRSTSNNNISNMTATATATATLTITENQEEETFETYPLRLRAAPRVTWYVLECHTISCCVLKTFLQ